MKRSFVVALLLFSIMGLKAQIEFRKINSKPEMEKVWEEARIEHKAVFVDIYATWCGPCKWMDANVFALERAGDYMNNSFINVKMDGESEYGREFAITNGLSAYPSFFLFDSERTLMNMIVGAKPWEELQPAIASTLEYFPVLDVLQNKYKSGLLKEIEYPDFIKALLAMGKEAFASQVAYKYKNDYIKDGEYTAADIKVMAFFLDQGSEDWNVLISDIPRLKSALGSNLVDFIDHSVSTGIEIAVDYQNEDIIVELNKILPELCKGTDLDPIELQTRSFIYYFHYSNMMTELMDYIDSEYKNSREGDHHWLFEAAASAVFLDPQNTAMARKGVEWFSTCISLEETQEYYYHLALCQYFTDISDEAVKSLKTSLKFTDDEEVIASTNSIILQIEAEMQQ